MIVADEKCHICGKESRFLIDDEATLTREAVCEYCGASLRNSDLAGKVADEFGILDGSLCDEDLKTVLKGKRIWNACSSGAVHNALLKNINVGGGGGYIYSEYFPDVPSGQYKNGVQCIDFERIPYDCGYFDCIISEDVVEHLEDYEKAFEEIKRVLKKGGCFIFTVPLHEGRKTVSRKGKAKIYHGDPVNPEEGCIVYTDWGDDIADIVNKHGFETKVCKCHDLYPIEQITDSDKEYEDYLRLKNHMERFFKYNSVVIVARKMEMDFTGERFIPGINDAVSETEHYQRYKSIASLVKGKKILDAACGEGYGSSYMADFAESVVGVDISDETVELANEKYALKKHNLSYKQASIENLSIFEDHYFDVVVSFETIEHVDENIQKKFFFEIKRILKKDGMLVMSSPNKKIYSDKYNYSNEFHVKELYKDEFLDLLNSHFKNIKLFDQYREVVYCLTDSGSNVASQILYTPNKNHPMDAKYFVAIASDCDIDNENIQSVFMNKENEYSFLIDRVLDLQKSDEEKNNHIKKLDGEIENRDGHIRQLMDNENGLKNEISKKDAELSAKETELNNRNIELSKKEEEIRKSAEEFRQEIKNRDGHIKQLMDSENKLINIVSKKESELSDMKDVLLKKDNELSAKETELNNRNIELSKKEEEITQKENERERLCQEIGNRDFTIQNLNNNVNGLTYTISQLQKEISSLKGSRSWRMTKPLRSFGKFCRSVKIIRWPVKFLLAVKRKGLVSALSTARTKLFGVSVKSFPRVEVSPFSFPERNLEWMGEEQRFNLRLFPETNGNYERFEMPKIKKPLVSIVIPVYNQFEYTFLCLKAIKAHSGDVPYEVIIADDHSDDLTKKIGKIIGNLKVVRNRKNLRFLKNCNNAAKRAKGKYILFLNNDTQVQPDWLKPLVDLIESRDDIGMVGSKFVYPDGTLQEAGGIVWKDASAWNYGHGDSPYLAQYSYVKEADYISGASIMIKADLWNEIGGFDEAFAPAYCEDTDLAFEIRKRGQKVMLQPASLVVHFEGKSNGTDLTSGQKAYQVINQKKFHEKWRDVLEREHEPNGVNVFASRDRTKGKKKILVIDHYVPTFDMDCGSRWTFQLLKLFISKNYNVKFIGDNYAIYEPYTTALNQLGIEVLYGAWYEQNWRQWILENRNNIDIVFFERPHITMKYIDFVKENTNAKLFYNGHDLHSLRIRREYDLKKDEKLLDESEYWKNIEFDIMRKVSCSYYPSFVEINMIHEAEKSINAKALPVQIFDDAEVDLTTKYNKEIREGLFFVGGFSHNPNVDAVLWFVENVFSKINRSLGIKFYVAGSNPPDEIRKLDGKNIVLKGFVSDEELDELYKKCRIVVVPLRYGAGVKGKVIEAMKNGVPLVTTSIGAEGVAGIENVAVIEDDADKMARKIEELYEDENALFKMSVDSRSFVAKNFTMEAAWNLIKGDWER